MAGRSFHKLLLNFTWWVNRKNLSGRNAFEGGCLGLDQVLELGRPATMVDIESAEVV